jgi:hypothetical protein
MPSVFPHKGGIAHTDQAASNVADHIALKNVLYQMHNQQRAYIVGNPIRLAIRPAKSTKESYAQDFLLPEQQQEFILQIHGGKRTKGQQHHRKLKDDRK